MIASTNQNIPPNHIVLQAWDVQDRIHVVRDPSFRTGTMADKTMPPVPTYTDNGTEWAWWGDRDDLPSMMRAKVESVPIAGAVLDKKIRMMQGNGIIYFKTEDLRKGPNVERAYDQRVEDWFAENRIEEEWFPAQCADFNLPYNAFSELILSKNRKEISGIYHISAEFARLGKYNKANQQKWLQYSYYFPLGHAQAVDNRVYLPLYQWHDRQMFMDNLTGYKFAWHTRFPTPGLIYYARPWWLGLFKEKGWMDVSAQVPGIVAAMQKNQITLKYIIAIPENYFIFRHPEWNTYTDAKRQELIDSKIADVNKYLSGSDNVFKSLSYVFKENEITGHAMGEIKVIPVDDKAKADTWVPSSGAADAQIVQGFGMDPSQIGLSFDNKAMGAGSGSDKRESFNIMITLNTPEQRLLLEPLNLISKFNKWGYTFVVDHTSHTTTNNQESGMVPSAQSTQVMPGT